MLTNEDSLPLDLLQNGELGEVTDVFGEPDWVHRMAELGLCVGRRVRMLQQGCPCLFEVEGCRLSMRGECTAQIFVRPLTAVV